MEKILLEQQQELQFIDPRIEELPNKSYENIFEKFGVKIYKFTEEFEKRTFLVNVMQLLFGKIEANKFRNPGIKIASVNTNFYQFATDEYLMFTSNSTYIEEGEFVTDFHYYGELKALNKVLDYLDNSPIKVKG